MIQLIDSLFTIYSFMLIARILLSWVPEWSDTRFAAFLRFYTDPYLDIFRRIIPPLGMIDISPVVALLALSFIESIVHSIFKFLTGL